VATAFKIALQHNTVVNLLTGASVFSLLAIAGVLLKQCKLKLAFTLFPANIKNALLLGSINPVIYYLVLFEAYDRLPAQVAQPVNYTWAITLSLLSVPLLKHALTRNDLFALLLGYSGVAVISFAGKSVTGDLDFIGLGLALFSTLLWALFWILNTRNKLDPIISLFHNFIVAVPVLIGVAVFTQTALPTLSFKSIGSIAYVGLFEMGITFVLWQMALHHTKHTARIGTLIFLSPFISLFLISAVLNEPLQWLTFLGLALIIVGVALAQRKSS
jgi:drug/metabolite transporter (DMT)-like permease